MSIFGNSAYCGYASGVQYSREYKAKRGPASKGRAYRARKRLRAWSKPRPPLVIYTRYTPTITHTLLFGTVAPTLDDLENAHEVKVTTKTTRAQAEALNTEHTPRTGRYLAAYEAMRERERERARKAGVRA